MDIDRLISVKDKYCSWITLKLAIVALALWGLVVGLVSFVNSMVYSINWIHDNPEEGTSRDSHVFSALQFFALEYDLSLIVIISSYLLYGTIRDIPEKSTYVLVWVIYGTVADTFTLFHLIKSSQASYKFFTNHFVDHFLVICMQFICLGFVYSYYRTLPKRYFPAT